ncbi:MAG: large subunit ribosomal protein [Candidatus Methanomethylophilaceae archaeon]|nr:large subunit ribosomal protein [Candidatus Methanomethylophilaceae archaeon]HIJ00912.1 50S ribosomal protein L22 [Candidatus Methanomethylophilaceae archaeon]
MLAGYTVKADPEITAKAIGKELPISPKHSREICKMIRGMETPKAKEVLEGVIALKRPVPMGRFKKRVSHKAGVGPGRFPQKAAKAILQVIESAEANAEYKGLDPENMIISTVSASLGRTIPGHRPRAYGRATQWNQQTVNIEVILEEVE